jgi:hypothetical protein
MMNSNQENMLCLLHCHNLGQPNSTQGGIIIGKKKNIRPPPPHRALLPFEENWKFNFIIQPGYNITRRNMKENNYICPTPLKIKNTQKQYNLISMPTVMAPLRVT